jgi:hypothetical protein
MAAWRSSEGCYKRIGYSQEEIDEAVALTEQEDAKRQVEVTQSHR